MTTQYRSDVLRDLLRALHDDMPDIRAAVVANVDGLLVTSYPDDEATQGDPANAESVAAMSAVMLALAERTLERLAQGAVQRVMIEGEYGTVVVIPATPDAALAALVSKHAKLGLALRAIHRCAEQIRAMFAR